MIYSQVKTDEPLSQGDIFVDVPRVDVSISHIARVTSSGIEKQSWQEVLAHPESRSTILAGLFPFTVVKAIVISQDCDAARSQFISLCQIVPYEEEVLGNTPPSSSKKWAETIVKYSRERPRYFYLPPGLEIQLETRHAVDFLRTIRLRREELQEFAPKLRMGRLNGVAKDHFRESIAHFFRRYSYNEWYSLDKDEFAEYQKRRTETIDAYPWQK